MNFKILKEKILVFFLLFLIIFSIFRFQSQIKNLVYLISWPIEKSIFSFSKRFVSFFELVLEKISLKEENEQLKLEIKKLIAENEKLKELKKENEELRKSLGLKLEKEFNLEMVRFTGKDISGDFIRINKGIKDGMKEGQVVITPENCLVGKIFKVYSNFSSVELFTEKGFSFDAKISEKEISGLVKGKGDFKAKIELLPKEKEISKGDKVLTSNLGGKFPAGILVGEIEKVKKSDLTFYQEAELKPAFDIKKFDYLFVILNF